MGDIFDIIRDKANHREDPVPQDAWENISGQKRRRRPAGFIWLAATLLFIALGIGLYQIFLKQDQQEMSVQINDKQFQPRSNTATRSGKQTQDQSTYSPDRYPAQSPSGSNLHPESRVEDKLRTSIHAENALSSPAPDKEKSNTGLSASNNVSPKHSIKQSPTQSGNLAEGQEFAFRKKKARKEKALSAMTVDQAEFNDNNNAWQKEQPLSGNINEVITDKEKSLVTTNIPVVISEPIKQTDSKEDQPLVTDKKNTEKKEDPALQPVAKTSDKEKKKRKPKTWSAEFAFTPTLFVSGYDHQSTFRRSVILNDSKSIFDGKLTRSHINPSVAVSAMLRKEINQKLNIGVGIQYQRMKELVRISGKQVNTLVVVGDVHLNPGENPEWISDTSNLVFEATGDINAINRYTFVSIPVSLQYKLWSKKKWSMAVESGLTLHVSTHYQNHINRNPAAPLISTTHKSTEKTNLGFTINAGLRFGRRINDHLDFFALPYIGINPVKQSIKNTIIDKNIHRAGVQIGMAWKLW